MKAGNKIVDVVRLALRNVVMHKARSGLTALSILFGVWSVIAMLAINEGASKEAQRALRELGSSNIIVESDEPTEEESQASAGVGGAKMYGLTLADARRLLDIPGVARGVITHRIPKSARVLHRQRKVTVIATEPIYAQVGRIEMASGRFISHADMLRRSPHCVLTAVLARKLFAYHEPLGETVLLDGDAFIVVGVLEYLPSSMAGEMGNPGDSVVIPLSTDQSQFGEFSVDRSPGAWSAERIEVSQIILQMKDERAVLEAAPIIRSLLERSHPKGDYSLKVPLELLEVQAEQRRRWNIMFTAIALISLLVGGIGIANIMLASVTERTREIGVRRAMGAKRRDITVQFLVEAVTLTTVGGLLGIAVGMLIPFAIRRLLPEVPAEPTLFMLILPFVVSVVVGLISGLWPALRAARLDPIVALRHE